MNWSCRGTTERIRRVVVQVMCIIVAAGCTNASAASSETGLGGLPKTNGHPQDGSEPVLFRLYDNSVPHLVEYETRQGTLAPRQSPEILGDGWKTRKGLPFWRTGATGVWATELSADLAVTVLLPRDLQLSLELMPHFLEELPPQRVEVFWNEHLLGEVLFDKEEKWTTKKCSFEVAREIQKRGRNKVTLSSRYAVSRSSVTGEGETREAAVALMAFSLDEKGGNPAAFAPLLNVRGERIVQNPYARMKIPLSLPDQKGLSFVAAAKGPGRLVLCEDSAYGPKETVLWEQRVTGGMEKKLRFNLAPWRASVVELLLECAGADAGDQVEWCEPRVLCDSDRKVAATAASTPGAPHVPKVKNVVLVVLDALRADALGCYGCKRDTSPFIDALAEKGLVFTQAYSAATETFASTTSLLTSLNPFAHGVLTPEDRLGDEGLLLQHWLRSRGVVTGCVSQNPFISGPNILGRQFGKFRSVFAEQDQSAEGCRKVTDAALTLARKFGEKRFFLYVHYLPPHAPYSQSGQYEHTFSSDPVKTVTGTPQWIQRAREGEVLFDQYGAAQLRARYDENVRRADECVKDLVVGLRAMGLGKETAVIVLSDHGEEFMEHGWVGHDANPFATQCHIPLVISTLDPEGLGAGQRRSDLVGTVDVASSICALLGVGSQPHAQGRDFFGTPTDNRAPYYTLGLRDTGVEGFTFERFRLLLDTASVGRSLYDLVRDPEENYDISTAFPVLTDYFEAEAMAWRASMARRFKAPRVPAKSENGTGSGATQTPYEEELRALGYL